MTVDTSRYPVEFVARLSTQLGPGDSVSVLEEMTHERVATIRVNPLKRFPFDAGLPRVEWCRDGVYLPERPVYTLDPHFHAGAYYVQESSSMFLQEVFRQLVPEGLNPRVLDLCGAPGGKATHLSVLAGRGGVVVTNEVIRQRATVLSENVTKWGLDNVIVTASDPSRFTALAGVFDILVVDAPCSGEGMFRSGAVINEWSQPNTRLCAERQKRILMDAWPALKEGGLLIYSTCTFNPEENEENMEWLSTREDMASVKLETDPEWGIKEITLGNVTGYGFYPGKVKGEGFFISVARKTSGGIEYGSRSGKRSSYDRLTSNDRSIISGWSDIESSRLIRINEKIIGAGCDLSFLELLKGRLAVVKTGTALALLKGSSYIPEHELALSVSFKQGSFPEIELTTDQSLGYLSRENVVYPSGVKGWSIVVYQGSRLGFLKNVGTRYNNYYPAEWRIRMNHE